MQKYYTQIALFFAGNVEKLENKVLAEVKFESIIKDQADFLKSRFPNAAGILVKARGHLSDLDDQKHVTEKEAGIRRFNAMVVKYRKETELLKRRKESIAKSVCTHLLHFSRLN